MYIPLTHKGKTVLTTCGSSQWLLAKRGALLGLGEGFIPAGYAHRPDLIANLFFDGVGNWPFVLLYNGVSDPFEELKLNDKIAIPNV